MDKLAKVREEVVRMRNLHQMKYQRLDTDDKMCLVECGKRNLCNDLLCLIDSLQEEPVSEDLEEAADMYSNNDYNYFDVLVTEYDGTEHWMNDKVYIKYAFKAGAKWQKEQLIYKLKNKEAKVVDIAKEIEFEYNPIDGLSFEGFERIAKYFFELGLKAQKGE